MKALTRLVSVTPPEAEPISIAEAKAHLRISGDNEDSYIESLISVARMHAEKVTRRAIITQTWDLYLDKFPGWSGKIEIPKAPLQSVTSITYTDDNGDDQTLDSSKYVVSTAGAPGRITPAYSLDWPATRDIIDAVRIRFVAGYEDSGSSPQDLADNVPEEIKHAIKLLVGHWYENREPIVIGTIVAKVPIAVDSLLAPYKVHTFY